MSRSILLVDDDALLRRSLAYNLEKAGYRATTSASAEEALTAIRQHRPDLVLLDIGLPGMDGLDALRRLRQEMDVPVIFLSARRRELDQVLGLGIGADDYVTKPFDIDVLVARIKAVLRRTTANPAARRLGEAPPSPLVVGDLIIDVAAHTVSVAGRSVELSPREFDLLRALAADPGKVISVAELLSRVWGAEYAGEPQVVYVHVRWLRQKIEADPEHPRRLLTMRRVGYKLVPTGGGSRP